MLRHVRRSRRWPDQRNHHIERLRVKTRLAIDYPKLTLEDIKRQAVLTNALQVVD
jgi:hypothetical protein